MGFFSNLKNAVTGGAATVQVQAQPMQRGVPSVVHIWAQAKASANVSGVYLLIRAVERAEVRDTDYNNGQIRNETVTNTKVSFEQRIPVAGPMQMAEGQQLQFQANIHLPQNVNPSFQGHIISHTWEVQAGLDMTGNDPDSGWVQIQVY